MKIRISLFAAIVCCLLIPGFFASAKESPSSSIGDEDAPAVTDESMAVEEDKEEAKTFAEAVEGYERNEGLFTLYFKEDENKCLLEIKPPQLDEVFLCNVTLEAGDGYFFDSGAMLDNFPFIFKRIGKKVQFIHKNVSYRADPSSPLARAVARGVSDSIIASSEIVSEPHPETGAILVDAGPLFIRDHINLSQWLGQMGTGFSFDPSESYFGALKSFPLNSEVEVVIHFSGTGEASTTPAIPDSRSMQHRYRYSLAVLPESDYRPRLADDRVGHFITMYQDYTDLTRETAYVRFVQRWNLRKKFPFEGISPPKDPIVFWLENAIPVEYRDAIRVGILEWNKAFEAIGFKDAIVVKQMPDDADWDPADIRYNVIQWIVMPESGYAVGPCWASPLTGEIYAADIRITADFVRSYAMDWEELVTPLSALSQSVRSPLRPAQESSHRCAYGEGLMREMAFGFNVLSARGELECDSPKLERFIQEGLKDLVTHEVGHTLGLRHNFRASTIHALDELHDTELTRREGISGSVMEYDPLNLAAKRERQGDYFQTCLGPYDYWAIEYAYKPVDGETPEDELPELEEVASRVAEPELTYGTDEDEKDFSPEGMDPLTNTWDLGSDPIAYYRLRIRLANELLQCMESEFSEKGTRYPKLRRVFWNVIGPYRMAALTVPKFVGGIYERRDHIGDPGERKPFEPVSAAKQREAMAFLKEYIFGPDAFQFPASLLNKLAPERLPDFEDTIDKMVRKDYPVHDVVLGIQKIALDRMYDPVSLRRMVDLPLHYENGEEPFTLADMFRELRFAVWDEVYASRNVNSFRRNLQRAHLTKLTFLVLKPGDAPEDASTLARADLTSLRDAIAHALSGGDLDEVTRAHLEESLARVKAALDAGIDRSI